MLLHIPNSTSEMPLANPVATLSSLEYGDNEA